MKLDVIEGGFTGILATILRRGPRSAALLWGFLLLQLLVGVVSRAQEIPRDQYIDYLPLEYPRLVRQTEADVRLHLFGNSTEAGYRDVDPRDGIDDRRGQVLDELAVRFAPFMVLNTTAVPMDFLHFMGQRSAFPLFVDTWMLGGPSAEIAATQSLNWSNLGKEHDGKANRDDLYLSELLEDFDPDHPADPYYSGAAVRPEKETFRVLFFDFPGTDPKSWKKEYENAISAALPQRYRSFIKAYVHPFIHEVTDSFEQTIGYELIMQYWFFYPFNDGGNNHEGDWEHINVVIAPLKTVDRLLDENTLQAILNGSFAPDGVDNPLVIRRIDYYFHNKVWPLDFSSPNAYLPREVWKEQVKQLAVERIGLEKIWEQIRYRAWFDHDETTINTHPICLIGADNKGLDVLLTSPGSKNRDSHGTYPFPGMYKDIGPGGATEQVAIRFDHRKWFEKGGLDLPENEDLLKRGRMVRFDAPDRLQMIPDWERIVPLVREDPQTRPRFAWMILPIRWGYPATESPFAGIVAHAETGNLSPVGPTYSYGWNVTKAGRTFALYEPHRFSSHFPLGVQDNYHNSWGFFNLTLPTLMILPPIDLLDRIVLAPVRVLFPPSPTYYPSESVPFRFVGTEYGRSWHHISEDWAALLFNRDQTMEIFTRLLLIDPDATVQDRSTRVIHDTAAGNQFTLAFFMGKGFVSENTIRHSRSDLGFEVGVLTQAEPFKAEGELNFWEYSGSLRFNIMTGTFLPYAKIGYGLSWYRVENVAATDTTGAVVPLENPNSPWVRKPEVFKWKNMWPNTFHLAAGMEWLVIHSNAPLLRGVDLSVRGELAFYHHNLGFKDIRQEELTLPGGGSDIKIWRVAGLFGIQLSF